ncbi:hypothetical protein PMSD_17685 [Paenibacillus macquariensis subsp. defensor]|nr:hypothetical protein PMSD_17685 [Paenibacillus macquariensis subsp. defensor]
MKSVTLYFDMALISDADIFVYNGIVEEWAEKAVEIASNEKRVVVEASHGIDLTKGEAQSEEIRTYVKTKEFVTQHAAFGYLEKEYGLMQVAIAGLSPEQEPTPAKMIDIVKFAIENHVTTIFFETLVDPKVAVTVAKLRVHVLVLRQHV